MATVKIDNGNFESDVLNSETPVVVDFWAEWCGPCKMIAPSLEEISNEMGDKVKIAKVNMDENPELAAKYGVRSIPTLLMFKGGEPVAIQVGAAPKKQIVRLDFQRSLIHRHCRTHKHPVLASRVLFYAHHLL